MFTWNGHLDGFSYRVYRPLWWGLLMAAAASALLARLSWTKPWLPFGVPVALLGLFALASLAPVFSRRLLLPIWYSVVLRGLALRLAGGFGRLRRLVVSNGRSVLTALTTLVGLVWLGETETLVGSKWQDWVWSGDLPKWLETLSAAEAFWILVLVWLAVQVLWLRRQIVVQPFVDLTGGEKEKKLGWVEAIGPQLLNDLHRLRQLYETVDEEEDWTLPVQQQPQAGKASPGVSVVAALRQVDLDKLTAVEVKAGPLQLPIGLLLRYSSRFFGSPQVTGTLHRENDHWVLLAQLKGPRPRSWRVECPITRPREPKETKDAKESQSVDEGPPRAMTEELACRVFTDLADVGTPRWRAVQAYSEGLRLYRETLRCGKDEVLNLRDAERKLLQALDEDGTFHACHYNLGVVYQALANPHTHSGGSRYRSSSNFVAGGALQRSVGPSFRKAVATDPDQPESQFALIQTLIAEGQLRDAWAVCEGGLLRAPDDPWLWSMRGLLLNELLAENDLVAQEITVALILRSMGRKRLCNAPESRLRYLLSMAGANLALTLGEAGRFRRAGRHLRQLVRLAGKPDDLYRAWGRMWTRQAETRGSRRAWRRVATVLGRLVRAGQGPQEQIDLLLLLARARAELLAATSSAAERELVRQACARLADVAVHLAHKREWEPPEALEARVSRILHLLSTHHVPGDPDSQTDSTSSMLRDLPAVLTYLQEDVEGAPQQEPGASGTWAEHQFAIQNALRICHGQDRDDCMDLDAVAGSGSAVEQQKCVEARYKAVAEARDRLEAAIKFLKHEHGEQIRSQGLDGELAVLHLRLAELAALCSRTGIELKEVSGNHTAEALAHAEAAAALDPESYWEHQVLAKVYQRLGQFQRAQEEWRLAITREPRVKLEVRELVEPGLGVALATRKPEKRRQALEQLSSLLEKGLRFREGCADLGSAPTDEMGHGMSEERGELYFWLGRIRWELRELDEAAACFRAAQQLSLRPDEAQLCLAEVLVEDGALDQAASELRQLVDHLEREGTRQGVDREAVHELLCEALLVQVQADLSRCALSGSLGEGKQLLDRLGRVKELLPKLKDRADLEAQRDFLLGWLRLEQRNPEAAIHELRKAISGWAAPAPYYHLARAFWLRAVTEGEDWELDLLRAREAYAAAGRADLTGEYQDRLKDLKQRIEAAEKKEPPKVRATAPEAVKQAA